MNKFKTDLEKGTGLQLDHPIVKKDLDGKLDILLESGDFEAFKKLSKNYGGMNILLKYFKTEFLKTKKI
mgnify:CR=1 FL=1|tara:strand:+ start:2506 stop:2712 length:207 start_codon:yes stop_codon:yes gene_type:complete